MNRVAAYNGAPRLAVLALALLINLLLALMIAHLVTPQHLPTGATERIRLPVAAPRRPERRPEERARREPPPPPAAPEPETRMPAAIASPEPPRTPSRAGIPGLVPDLRLPPLSGGGPWLGEYRQGALTGPAGPAAAAPAAPFLTSAPTRQVQPLYPYFARAKGIEGHVLLEFTVDASGNVQDIEILAAEPRGVFEKAALDAVRRWHFGGEATNSLAGRRWKHRITFALAPE